jgi:hypothetical protein
MGQAEKRKRENIRIINSCRSVSELRAKMGLLKIWRVEIEEDEEENLVTANGYCGYVSVAQIRAPFIRRMDSGVRSDRLEIGMAIRDIISGAQGEVREGFNNFRDDDLNAKERAEKAYRKIMKENGTFLDYRGLERAYWLNNWLLEDRCGELDFSM